MSDEILLFQIFRINFRAPRVCAYFRYQFSRIFGSVREIARKFVRAKISPFKEHEEGK